MNFDFNEDQRTIKATARELLAGRSPFERVRAAAEAGRDDDALWRELCELGWPGIAIAEEHGGQGLGAVELAVLLEELGYAVAATPLLGSALAGARDRARRRRRAARPLAAGAGVRRADRRVRRRPDLVAGGADAAVIVLAADGGLRAASPRADADVEPIDAIDPTRRYARVRGDGPALGRRRRRAGPRGGPRSPPSWSASASARST